MTRKRKIADVITSDIPDTNVRDPTPDLGLSAHDDSKLWTAPTRRDWSSARRQYPPELRPTFDQIRRQYHCWRHTHARKKEWLQRYKLYGNAITDQIDFEKQSWIDEAYSSASDMPPEEEDYLEPLELTCRSHPVVWYLTMPRSIWAVDNSAGTLMELENLLNQLAIKGEAVTNDIFDDVLSTDKAVVILRSLRGFRAIISPEQRDILTIHPSVESVDIYPEVLLY